ncbi:hypothetical protein DYBT9623_02920 [Dyadobacter sp. CECT 9623]|uniref:Uncharacterized protein n=1 Tax=Dyadobacter linearis TaxID=2823330 RepID=A0ABM8US42_9BACT|nr:hypothetical protein [Dyadobacter sp. CECT 9623]CAG5070180.1 hypothetical protein DYBT9623_02920 [Dyadobacter sp. CECT 9623]
MHLILLEGQLEFYRIIIISAKALPLVMLVRIAADALWGTMQQW